MTLVIVAANHDFVVQISDRRLTSGPHVVDEEATKTIYLETPTTQAIVGYTGLARVGRTPMNEVILDLLEHRALPHSPMDPLLAVDELGRALNEYFATGAASGYRARDKRLTIVITGFFHASGAWVGPVQWLVTNFQNWDDGTDQAEAWPEFTIHFRDPTPGTATSEVTLVERVGQWPTVTQEDAENLRSLLDVGVPAHAVRDKAVEMIESRALTEPTIGRQMNSVILKKGEPPIWKYHTAHNSDAIYLGDAISVEEDGSVLKVSGQKLERIGGIAVVPRTHRSAPCPCASGKTYGDCHGLRRGSNR